MNLFTTEQLIDFGNYLLSEYRMNLVAQKGVVHDADLSNWIEKINADKGIY